MNKEYCFIGGAPKCGTSTVFDVLASLKEVVPSKPKETFYFIEKTNPLLNKSSNFHLNGFEGFDCFFNEELTGTHLEGTTHLLFQLDMIRHIKQINGKVVFILRSPANRIYSSFSYTKHNLGRIKSGLDFEDYVKMLMENNVEGLSKWVSNKQSLFVLQRELAYSTYINYLIPWKSELGDNLKVMFYESMVEDSVVFYTELCEFFEIPLPSEFNTQKKTNTTRGNRFQYTHYLLGKLRDRGVFKAKAFDSLKRIYLGVQSKKQAQFDHRENLHQLDEYFLPHNTRLSEHFDVDLPWLNK